MKRVGAVAVVLGFVVWIGGEFAIPSNYNLVGLPILFAGAVLYFIGRKRTQSASSSAGEGRDGPA
jgi:hypothetical protein